MREINIAGNIVGDGHRTFVIAEAGANWRFCPDQKKNYGQALKLIDIAKAAGADAVKFQVYRADKLYVGTAGKAGYLKKERPIYDIIKDMELPYEWLSGLKKHCDKRGILFLATPFDEGSARELGSVGVAAYKIASYTISYLPFLKFLARSGKPIILSTGASSLADIDRAVEAIRGEGNDSIALMQCTAKYPAPLETINLRSIPYLKERYGVPAGLSDHSREPYAAPLGAVTLGANIIEKHFTVSNDLEGPDHAFAVLPEELAGLISGIRGVEKALGDGKKYVLSEEQELYDFCRRKIYAAKTIKAGEILTRDNIVSLRPGRAEKGIDSSEFDAVLGKKARTGIKKDQAIKKGMIR